MSSSSLSRLAIIVGCGPGIGFSVARKFSQEGFIVALISRKSTTVEPIKQEIIKQGGKASTYLADASESKELIDAFNSIKRDLGNPEVLVFNAGAFIPGSLLDLKVDQLQKLLSLSVGGALNSLQQVLPAMVENKRGTVILTGATASLRGSAKFAGLAVPKFGLRALGQSAAREFGPHGIHVCHAIIDGQVLTDSSQPQKWNRPLEAFIHPDAVAETYWNLHKQDKSAFTQEIDIRPFCEKF